MNEVHSPTTPPAEPKTEAHADAVHAGAVPEAEASVERVTEPDPEHAPEPEPAPPPEFAEVAAATGENPVAEPAHEPEAEAQEHAPVPEPVSEELVPVHEQHESMAAPTEHAPAEVAPVVAETVAEEPQAETELEAAEEAPAEEEPKAKPKRTRAAKAPKAPAAAGAAPAPAPTDTVTPTEAPGEPKPESKKKWYAIKVQSGREDTIKSAILRKVAIEGLEEYFGQIVIPVEEEVVKKTVRVKDKKTGEYTTQEKKVTRKKKKFQGYLFAELEFNDRILYLFRETSGVGDFLNLRGTPPVPEPMPEHEVQSMLTGEIVRDKSKGGAKKIKVEFEKGDRVRIREGPFANSEGEVKMITEPKDPADTPKITVVVTLWGRPVDVDLDYWQVEKA